MSFKIRTENFEDGTAVNILDIEEGFNLPDEELLEIIKFFLEESKEGDCMISCPNEKLTGRCMKILNYKSYEVDFPEVDGKQYTVFSKSLNKKYLGSKFSRSKKNIVA